MSAGRVVRLALTGDVMLGRGVNQALESMEPAEPWGDLLPRLLAADLRLMNLECALTSHLVPWQRSFKVFHFRADPSAVRTLQAARVDAVSLANNHSLDFEESGLLETLETLSAAGIRAAGAGRDAAEAARPVLLEAGALKVGLVAFTDNEPLFAAGPGRPGTNWLPVSLDSEVLGRVEAALAAARRAGAEVVVFSNHWGPNMVERPAPEFRQFAHAVIELGADLYWGHSAHIFQGVELYRGRPILYDTGDFLDDYAVDPLLRNDWSFLFEVSLARGPSFSVELFPVLLPFAQVRSAPANDREAIFDRMARLSSELGTTLVRRRHSLLLPSEPPAESPSAQP